MITFPNSALIKSQARKLAAEGGRLEASSGRRLGSWEVDIWRLQTRRPARRVEAAPNQG